MAITGRMRLYMQLRNIIRNFSHESRTMSTSVSAQEEKLEKVKENVQESIDEEIGSSEFQRTNALLNYRFVYPEFLPDPNPMHRNTLREKLERRDMLARRSNVEIPEFYVGSIVAVTHSDKHAPGKSNRFLGICIQRKGCGLRASFILRNVIDHLGVEVNFDLYDPTIQKIDVIRLEKRLDDELLYLRDAPAEYSTFPLDMEPVFHIESAPVPVNDIKVQLKSPPWLQKWERSKVKGIVPCLNMVSERRQKRAVLKMHTKPWEEFDLMKMYRETIPIEEQIDIWSEIQDKLQDLELHRYKMKRSRTFLKPKKSG